MRDDEIPNSNSCGAPPCVRWGATLISTPLTERINNMNPMADLEQTDVELVRKNPYGGKQVMTAELWLVDGYVDEGKPTYCIIMSTPGDPEEAFILPEMIQNLIPIYLPMLRGR